MGDRSGIEWTDATWNPTVGCDRVSPGCDNCYAIGVSHRFSGQPGTAFTGTTLRVPVSDGTQRTDWTGQVNLVDNRLDQPLRWTRPRRVFVNSMSDLFHDQVPDDYIAQVFAVMTAAPQHTFQILTKRHGRMRSLLSSRSFREGVDHHLATWAVKGEEPFKSAAGKSAAYAASPGGWPLPNVWLGVSVEDQKRAALRLPALVDTPAAVRFVSAEPLLGDVWAAPWLDTGKIGWLIVGGESGTNARPMNPRWARSLRDQCARHGVPFLFKQWGNWAPAPYKVHVADPTAKDDALAVEKIAAEATGATHVVNHDGYLHRMQHKPWSVERNETCPPEWEPIRHYDSKHAAGRVLDGHLHDGYPA